MEPLIEANWNQGDGWTDMCPSNTYVGCVAVAMGQVMHHWQHPYTGTGFNMYYLPDYGFLSADFETHKVEGYIIRLHSEAGFVWDERLGRELAYRLLYIPKVWQQREGRIPLFRGVAIEEKEWQDNIFSSGVSIGWETKASAWPMVYMDAAVVNDNEGTLLERIDRLHKSDKIYMVAGIGLESQTMMEIGLYFPVWVSHPVGGEDNFALRMLMQWGFYF